MEIRREAFCLATLGPGQVVAGWVPETSLMCGPLGPASPLPAPPHPSAPRPGTPRIFSPSLVPHHLSKVHSTLMWSPGLSAALPVRLLGSLAWAVE